MSCDGQFRQDIQVFILCSTSFACPPLKYVYMERISTPHPKILLHILILQTWDVKPKDLRALTSYSPSKERVYIHRILVNSISLYKHQAPSSPRSIHYKKNTGYSGIFFLSCVFIKRHYWWSIAPFSTNAAKISPIAAL